MGQANTNMSGNVLPLSFDDIPFSNELTDQQRNINIGVAEDLIRHYNKTAPSMPKNIQQICRDIAIKSCQHTTWESVKSVSRHPLYKKFYDRGVYSPENANFQTYWALAGVYGCEHPDLETMRQIVSLRYNTDIPVQCTWPGQPVYNITWRGTRGARIYYPTNSRPNSSNMSKQVNGNGTVESHDILRMRVAQLEMELLAYKEKHAKELSMLKQSYQNNLAKIEEDLAGMRKTMSRAGLVMSGTR